MTKNKDIIEAYNALQHTYIDKETYTYIDKDNWKFTIEEIYRPIEIEPELVLPRLEVEKKINASFKLDVNFFLKELKRLWDRVIKSQKIMHEAEPVLRKKQSYLTLTHKKEWLIFLELLKKNSQQFILIFLYVRWSIFIIQALDTKARHKEKFHIRMIKNAYHTGSADTLRALKITFTLTLLSCLNKINF